MDCVCTAIYRLPYRHSPCSSTTLCKYKNYEKSILFHSRYTDRLAPGVVQLEERTLPERIRILS